MQQEKNNQFKVPDNDGDNQGADIPPQAAPGSYQEPTPKVDNFSPPKEGESSSDSFQMPPAKETKTPPPEQPPSGSLKPETSGEPEDLFAEPKKEETPSPPLKPESKSEPPSSAGGQKLDIPSEKKGHGCLWGIVAAIILILFLAGFIFVNEWGILNLGLERYYGAIHLERLWGGLPKDSKAALANCAQRMKGLSFNLEGSDRINLIIEAEQTSPPPTAGTPPTASPTAAVSTLPEGQNVQGLENAATKDIVSQILKEGLDQESEVEIEAKINNKDRFEVNLSTSVEEAPVSLLELFKSETLIDLIAVYDNNDIYVKDATAKKILSLDKDWLKIINAPAETGNSPKASNLNDIISGGERIGWEKVNGVACYVYEVKINSSALSNYLVSNYPNLSWLGREVNFQTAKFYLGKRDHYLRRAEINFYNSHGKIMIKNKLVLTFKDIGSNIQVALPAPEETVEKNWGEVKSVFVSGEPSPIPTATTTPAERDQKRKSDLKKLQDALLAYKVQNGNYPSTLGKIEKTRDTTSILKTALVPKYLDSLPLDPENDKYYYGYKSDDSSKCEITCVLEDRSDPDGEDISGLWIYKLRGN